MYARMCQTGFLLSVLGLLIAAVSPARMAVAQDESFTPYVAAVIAEVVPVRCGGDLSFYSIGQLQSGQFVRVVGERNGFARVALIGPGFASSYGYVKYPKSQASRVRLEGDRGAGVTLGRLDVLAPNHQAAGDPAQSWKPLVRLAAEERINVLETIQTDREVIHKIALPPSAEGWISLSHLRHATTQEQAAFEETIKSGATTMAVAPAPSAESAPVLAREEQSVEPIRSPVLQTPVAPTTSPSVAPLPSQRPMLAAAPATSSAPAPAATAETLAIERMRNATLAELEEAYKRLSSEPTRTAEIAPLREQYLTFAARSTTKPAQARYANGRAQQLQIWAEAQQRLIDLAQLHARAEQADLSLRQSIAEFEARREYDAIGRLEASAIYDGHRLPHLLRLQDVSTGRTIAYLHPDAEGFTLVSMLGQLVGVVGEKNYDGGLGLNLITPRRVEPLRPREETAAGPAPDAASAPEKPAAPKAAQPDIIK
jgi:hypothetical protein